MSFLLFITAIYVSLFIFHYLNLIIHTSLINFSAFIHYLYFIINNLQLPINHLLSPISHPGNVTIAKGLPAKVMNTADGGVDEAIDQWVVENYKEMSPEVAKADKDFSKVRKVFLSLF